VTTFEPGASVVLTHGLALRPFFAALRARMPAAIITDGFDVFVHEVIAAMATAPWSIVNGSPSAMATEVGFDTVPGALDEWTCTSDGCASCRSSTACSSPGAAATGSDAGKVSATALSSSVWSMLA
jgi:hypothetical protein